MSGQRGPGAHETGKPRDTDLPAGLGSAASITYADVLLSYMNEERISLRALAERSGLRRSRLGVLLHRRVTERATPSLEEFHTIVRSLGLTMFEVVIRAETLGREEWRVPRYAPVIVMLARLFRDLPGGLMTALEEVDQMDGTEVRPEWAIALERALVKRIVQEVNAITARRATLTDFSF